MATAGRSRSASRGNLLTVNPLSSASSSPSPGDRATYIYSRDQRSLTRCRIHALRLTRVSSDAGIALHRCDTTRSPSETAPLLDAERRNDSFFSALTHPTRRLTNLEKVLGLLGIILLLLTSTFVGLFAGAEHALKKEKQNGGWHTTTQVVTATRTATGTHSGTSSVHPAPTGSPNKVCSTHSMIENGKNDKADSRTSA